MERNFSFRHDYRDDFLDFMSNYKDEFSELKVRVLELEEENSCVREALDVERSKNREITGIAHDTNILRE